jgi:hypothetical protein
VAYLRKRERTGGQPSWQVRWRLGGHRAGRWQGVTARSREQAKSVRAVLEAHGDALRADDPRIRAALGRERARDVLTFGEVAERYIATRTTAKPTTRAAYSRMLRMHLAGLARPTDHRADIR